MTAPFYCCRCSLAFGGGRLARPVQRVKKGFICQLCAREELISTKAKAQQGTRTDISPILAKSIEAIDTREELSTIARVSHGTLDKVRKIEAKGTPEQKAKLEAGRLATSNSGRPSNGNNDVTLLKDYGISKMESSRAQEAGRLATTDRSKMANSNVSHLKDYGLTAIESSRARELAGGRDKKPRQKRGVLRKGYVLVEKTGGNSF